MKLKMSAYSLDLIYEYQVITKTEKRPRTEEEKRERKLPLQSYLGLPGSPKHLVNMIELPVDQEGLRDTVVNNICGPALVFDTLEDSESYQLYCRKKKKRHGTLLVLDQGLAVGGDGLGEGNNTVDLAIEKNMSKKDYRLPFVFGSLPLDAQDDYKSLKAAFENGREVLSALKNYQSALASEQDVEEKKIELDRVESETKELESKLHRNDRDSSNKSGGKKKKRRT